MPAALTRAPPQGVWLTEQEKARRADADRFLLQWRILDGSRMSNTGFLRSELGDGAYDLLESQLAEARDKVLADVRYEEAAQNIAKFNEGLGITSDEDRPLIDAWVKQRPGSAWAHYAEAARWYDIAWKVRGDGSAKYTPPDALSKAHQDFAVARNEVRRALKIDPSIPTAWVTLLEIDRSDAGLDAVKHDFSEALAHYPHYGFLLYSAYLSALGPAWFGSYDMMEDFAREQSQRTDANPRIWMLQGILFGDRGCIHCSHEDWQTGLKLLNQALAYSDYLDWLDQAGEAAMHLHRYALAYQYYQRASFYGGDEKIKYLMAMGLMQERCDPSVTELHFLAERSQVDSITGLPPMDYPRVPGDCSYYQAELPWGDEPVPSAGDIAGGYDLHMEFVMASLKKKH
jgi:tetratricopeptide (TPR) repeat protein